MTATRAMAVPPAATASPADSRLPLLLLLFVLSGGAALIYQIVWFQMLSLIIGSSTVSMGVLLATFMGGMCVGSLWVSRVVPATRHPVRVYAYLELGIGVFGLVVLALLPWVGGLYTAVGGPGVLGITLRAIFCALFLLPPTILMGATLPAISRWIEATPKGVSWMGFLYGANTGGAVLGALLAGFVLLRVYDTMVATFVAVAINAVVGLAALQLARTLPQEVPAAQAKPGEDRLPPGSWPVLVTIGLSGMTALGAEVVWTRLLSLSLGGTVYTFSLILAVFLLGLGLGSYGGSFMARSAVSPRSALGWSQVFVMAGLAWAAYSLTQVLPWWPINPALATAPRFTFQIDLVRALWVVLPGAFFWGASFPLALAAVAAGQKDPGRAVGAVYAANTVGAIVGSLVTAIALIGWIGTQQTQRLLVIVAGISALFMLATAVNAQGRVQLAVRNSVSSVIAIALALWFAGGIQPIPGLLVAYGRYMVTWIESAGEILFWDEGVSSSMAVSQMAGGVMNYHNAGKVQASSDPVDMRLQRMLGHLTTLLPERPGQVLVIGCGAGVTAGAVSIDPAVERVVIAEIEPLVPRFVAQHFSQHNNAVISNPKVEVRIDDARHYLLTTGEKFDAITSDPFDPWVKGAANLYTKEFFEVVRDHLNPGGVVTVFVQLYESSLAAVKSEIATFLEVFPNGTVWANTASGQGYDLVIMGQLEHAPINIDAIEARLSRPEYGPVAYSLSEIGFSSAIDLFSTFAGQGPDLRPWLSDAEINRDRNLRLQYLAGLGLNLYEQDRIYQDMVSHRRIPNDLFTGSPERVEAVRSAIMWGQ